MKLEQIEIEIESELQNQKENEDCQTLIYKHHTQLISSEGSNYRNWNHKGKISIHFFYFGKTIDICKKCRRK